jgi:hypothetical protein
MSIYIRQHDNEDEYYADKQLGMTIDSSSSSWFVMMRQTLRLLFLIPRRLVVYQNEKKKLVGDYKSRGKQANWTYLQNHLHNQPQI